MQSIDIDIERNSEFPSSILPTHREEWKGNLQCIDNKTDNPTIQEKSYDYSLDRRINIKS